MENYSSPDINLAWMEYCNITDKEDGCNIHVTTVLSAVVCALVFLLGPTINGFVLWIKVSKMEKKYRSILNLHLFFSGFMVSLIQPLDMVYFALDIHWPFGSFLCRLNSAIFYLYMFVSGLLLTLLSVDYCLVVFFPFRYTTYRTKELASIQAIVIWIFSLGVSVPYFLYKKTYDCKNTTKCIYGVYENEKVQYQSLVITAFVLGFFLPFLVIILCLTITGLFYHRKNSSRRKIMNLFYDDNITQYDSNFTIDIWEEEENTVQKYFDISRVVLFTITAIVGIIGNGLVIWITGFKMKSVSAVWFLNLAVADFISCLFLLCYILEWVLPPLSIRSVIFCIIRFFMLSLNMLTSVYFLMVISLDRCVSTMWPLWTRIHRRLKPARIISAIIWVFCLVSGCMYEAYHFLDSIMNECLIKRYLIGMDIPKDEHIIRLIFMFVLPFTIILVSYSVVAFKIRARKRWHKSKRPFRVIIALVLCFFICWFPFHLSSVTPAIDETDEDPWKYVLKEEICLYLAYFNSCLNPIIYVLLGPEVKSKTLRSRIESAVTEHNDRHDRDDITSTTLRTRERCSSAL
ncbi:N-formyl peptide receptor 3-like [Dendropsophus ebraccatus]|uniref:N-formyl peptide receptor 3-like n=1 Tax=Dendropsophus ebraccatus TaxID=150705 RepID=UPI0038313B12